MLPEITDFAGPVTIIAGGLVVAVIATAFTGRVPIPAPALFLAGAALASDIFPSLGDQVAIITVERVAVVALIVILFNGGRDIGAARMRRSIGDVAALGLLGTFVTAAALAVAAHFLLGLDWPIAGVLGAALAPTDPAVMFSVLGRREVGGRSGTVLEGEAGINDPAGIALLLGMVEVATHHDASILVVLREFVVEMSIGLAIGVIGGVVLVRALGQLRLAGPASYPVFSLAAAGLLYGVTALAGGSGFLAVFVAGLLLGDARLPYGGEIDRFTASLASLAEIAVFVALGLTIDLGAMASRDWLGGIALFAAMTAIVRPAVVGLTLVRSALTVREKTFVAWGGLKGAVPILLGAFAVLGNVPESQRLYDIVFVVVLASVVVQGGLMPAIAKRLAIPMHLQPDLPWELSVRLAHPPHDRVEVMVEPGSRADGAVVSDLPLGRDAWVTLVVRDATAVAPRPNLVLREGDVVFLLGVANESEFTVTFTSDTGDGQ